jgi:hypothetical protein
MPQQSSEPHSLINTTLTNIVTRTWRLYKTGYLFDNWIYWITIKTQLQCTKFTVHTLHNSLLQLQLFWHPLPSLNSSANCQQLLTLSSLFSSLQLTVNYLSDCCSYSATYFYSRVTWLVPYCCVVLVTRHVMFTARASAILFAASTVA